MTYFLYKKDWSDKDKIAQSILDDFLHRIGLNISPHIVSKTIHALEVWENNLIATGEADLVWLITWSRLMPLDLLILMKNLIILFTWELLRFPEQVYRWYF